ncbi:MAG: hypothetical protein KIT81_17935, partial [Alphaproteobacteria bacterium]|nr:hypothetical protein [Alphaproteobacteria bacterium]
MIAEIAEFQPGHAPHDGDTNLPITQSTQPLCEQVPPSFGGQVMLDFVKRNFRLLTNHCQATAEPARKSLPLLLPTTRHARIN